jgi:hypothetical protein
MLHAGFGPEPPATLASAPFTMVAQAARIEPALDPPRRQVPRMTVLRSASGSRMDCEQCAHHVAAPGLSIEGLRRARGYVEHDGRDYCPSCWYEHTSSGFPVSRQVAVSQVRPTSAGWTARLRLAALPAGRRRA